MSFGIEEAVEIANQLASGEAGRNLTDVEISILKGSWEKLEYDQIAAQNKYATSYISQDAAPKLWKMLGSALGEKVRKSNFKEALKRAWNKQFPSDQFVDQSIGKLINNNQNSSSQNGLSQNGKSDGNGASIASSNITDYLARDSKSSPTSVVNSKALSTELFTPIYVERPPIESMCFEALQSPSALIRIKAPRFMGKTYLSNCLLHNMAASPYRTAGLSFELADRNTHFTDLNKFLRWMCLNIARELKVDKDIDEIWDEEGIGAKVSCTAFFEECLLTQSEQPLVLCLDDVDLLFPHPEVYEDFFGLLRSWHEKAKKRPLWQRLRLIIVHATDVYIRLNINQSPFNVGLAIELPEFSTEQVNTFAQLSGIVESSQQIDRLMDWIGGHPYLLEQTFMYLKTHEGATIEQLINDERRLVEVYQDHLRSQWVALQENEQLVDAFTQMIHSDEPVQLDPMMTYQLQSMGLVKSFAGRATVRCQLYTRYFTTHLAQA